MQMNVYMNNQMLVSEATHPFKAKTEKPGKPSIIEVPISDIFLKFELEQLRKFIHESIKDALTSEEYDRFTNEKLGTLMSQLYQPNSFDTLVSKLVFFEQHLFNVKEYQEWMQYLKNRR